MSSADVTDEDAVERRLTAGLHEIVILKLDKMPEWFPYFPRLGVAGHLEIPASPLFRDPFRGTLVECPLAGLPQ
jgi:hypothetical protein